MAALLKKRALAEYGAKTQVTEPPWKRFKMSLLKKKSQRHSTNYCSLLKNCKNTKESLKTLLYIAEVTNMKDKDLSSLLKLLCDYFNLQTDSIIKVQVLSLLCTLGQRKDCDVGNVIEQVMKLIKHEISHAVIYKGLKTLMTLSKSLDSSSSMFYEIFAVAKWFLNDTGCSVKKICLQLIAAMNEEESLKLIPSYMYSQDSRVRCTAFEILHNLYTKGYEIDISLYSGICSMLKDDCEAIRVAVLKLVSLFGKRYPDSLLEKPHSDDRMRLIDDAFVKICQAVNDSSMAVRIASMQLLGTMTAVSKTYLHNTLDKKLMSNLRKKETIHARTSKLVTSGKWYAGKKWTNDITEEFFSKDEVNMLFSGECGALIQGLEDDCMEIRIVSLNALCLLAAAHPEFAAFSLDFLVDMLSDEIEAVRLKSIEGLNTMSYRIIIREHQLETILGTLEDSSLSVREGLHKILGSCNFSSQECLKICIEGLLNCLKKYPSDKKLTWESAKNIGRAHSHLLLPMIPGFLGVHPFFDLPEPNVEDPCYITLMIIVFHVTENCPSTISLFSEQTLRHYNYLRVRVPSLVPHLEFPETSEFFSPVITLSNGVCLLRNLIESISFAPSQMFHNILPQLDTLAKIDPLITGPAKFTALFISCQILLSRILKNNFWFSNSITDVQRMAVKEDLAQLASMCLKLQYLFTGIDKPTLACVKQIYLISLVILIIFRSKTSIVVTITTFADILEVINKIRQFLLENNLVPIKQCKELLSAVNHIEGDLPNSVCRHLLPYLRKIHIFQPPMPNLNLRMCSAELNLPPTSADSPLKFTASLVMSVELEAFLFSLNDKQTLKLKISYPNDEVQLIKPADSDLHPQNSEGDYRLGTKVLLYSRSSWSEACYVEISLCVEPSDGKSGNSDGCGLASCLELCKPCRLHIRSNPVSMVLQRSIL